MEYLCEHMAGEMPMTQMRMDHHPNDQRSKNMSSHMGAGYKTRTIAPMSASTPWKDQIMQL